MSAIKLEPFLCFGGIEVANAVRTLTYLRRGLGGAEWTVHTTSAVSEGAGYVDVYGDIYEADLFSPVNLSCYCAAISDAYYISPATDDAPWYQAANPESGEFLGLMIDQATLDAVMTRTVAAQAPVGAALTRMRPKQRVLGVKGQLLASTRRGMAWGERWLTDVLSGAGCNDSDLVDALILPACPDSDDIDPGRYFRSLVGAGVIDGPNFGPLQDTIPECKLQSVDFQIAAESPYLWHPPVEIINDLAGTLNAEATTDSWGGDAVLRLTVTAYSPFTAVVTATPLAQGQSCPTAGSSACVEFTIESLPAGNELVIDPVERVVSETNQTSKQVSGGLSRLSFDGIFQWLELPPCSTMCVTVAALSGTASVLVEQVTREL